MNDLESRVVRLEQLAERLSEDLESAERLIGQLASSRERMWRAIDALTHEAGLDQ